MFRRLAVLPGSQQAPPITKGSFVTSLFSPISLYRADCRDVLRTLADNSIDSVVSDPPYALVSIGKRFGKEGSAPAKSDGATGVYARASAGFMGQSWDTGEVAFSEEFWREVYRVLKPGGHVVSFGGTRTYHRMACAIEDAGFEIRDQIQWLYGTGFPKSHSAGNGWGTALKPANEPICLARKPLEGTVAQNVLKWGTGAINIDGCRVGDEVRYNAPAGNKAGGNSFNMSVVGMPKDAEGRTATGRFPANVIHDGSDEVIAAFPTATARFFYSAKASKSDRGEGNSHPTVKPTELMRYLCRLVTPPGGVVLDPFMGSGSTGKAAKLEGFEFIGIEREEQYFQIAKGRVLET